MKRFEIVLKVLPTKRKDALEKLNHISFFTWAVTENTNFWVFLIYLECKNIEQLNFFGHFVSQIGLKIWKICIKTKVLLKILKKNWLIDQNSVKNQRLSDLFQNKSALFSSESAVFQRQISAETGLFSADF